MAEFLLALLLAGRVVAADGQPIAGAEVTARDATHQASTITAADGTFSLASIDLPATIDVAMRGFAPLHRTLTAPPGDLTLTPAIVVVSVDVVGRAAVWREGATGATVLDRGDLERLPAVTLDDTLRAVSGFSLFRRSASRASNPTTQGVTMRGLSASGSSRALILLDGVPLNDGFGGWVTWTRLPPQAIARVDVVRGAAGDAFGTDALGGVIRVVTRNGESPTASLAAQVGSEGTGSADLSAGRRYQRVSLFGATSWFRTDGVIPLAAESRGIVDQRADADWFSAFGRADTTWAAHRLTISGWGGRDDRGNGTRLQRNRMSGGTFTAAYTGVAAGMTVAARASSSPNRFDQTFTSVAATRATETLTSTQAVEGTTTRAVVEIGGFAAPRLSLLGRATVARARADFIDVRPTTTISRSLRDDSEALSGEALFRLTSQVTLTAGLRHEWRKAPTDDDARDQTTVGHLAAAWRASTQLTLRGSATTSHRWPTLNELVRNFQVGSILTQANPELLPERARGADAGVTFTSRDGGHWLLSAGTFWTVVEDAVANVTITNTIRQRRNAGDAHARGVEFDAEAQTWSRLRLRGSATYADATFAHSQEPLLEGRRLPQVPRVSASIAADLTLPRAVVATVLWHATTSQFDDDRNQFLLGRASQIDLRVAGHLRLGSRLRGLGWHCVIENAADNRIEVGRTPLVTLAPDRAFRVGLTWQR